MNPAWRQVFVHFDPWENAELRAVTHLAPNLVDAETTGARVLVLPPQGPLLAAAVPARR